MACIQEYWEGLLMLFFFSFVVLARYRWVRGVVRWESSRGIYIYKCIPCVQAVSLSTKLFPGRSWVEGNVVLHSLWSLHFLTSLGVAVVIEAVSFPAAARTG